MANYKERNRLRYRGDEESHQAYQGRYSDYEGNPFSDEGEEYGTQYGRGGRYSDELDSPRGRRMGYEYDVNYRNQGFSSSSQSNTGQYDRSRDAGANQGNYGYPMNQPGSEYGMYGSRMGERGQSRYIRGDEYDEPMRSHRGKGPKGWKRADDSIYEEVCQILEQRPDIDPTNVEVKVRNGEVTLEGTVTDRMTKRRIEEALDMVSGVSDVQNRIRIQAEDKDGSQTGQNRQSQSNQSQRSQKSTATNSDRSEN